MEQPTLASAINDADNYTRWIIEVFLPYWGPRVLEVGLGHGNYCRFFPTVDKYFGVDIDPAAIEKTRRNMPSGEFHRLDVSGEEFLRLLSARGIEVILCVNVLEHAEDDRRGLANLLEVLEPGGRLLLLVPAFQALYNDLDRLAGHHRRYTRSGLLKLLPERGVELLRAEYFNPIGGLGWLANRLIRHRDMDGGRFNHQVRFFDQYVLPFSRLLNPLARGFFGQSLILAVRKK